MKVMFIFALVIKQGKKMKLKIDLDTSRNSLLIELEGMKQEDYSELTAAVLDRAKEFIAHLPEHIPDNDPKCDEYGNIIVSR